MHMVGAVMPVVGQRYPAGQPRHTPPAVGLYVPVLHSVHTPALLYCPLGQMAWQAWRQNTSTVVIKSFIMCVTGSCYIYTQRLNQQKIKSQWPRVRCSTRNNETKTFTAPGGLWGVLQIKIIICLCSRGKHTAATWNQEGNAYQ